MARIGKLVNLDLVRDGKAAGERMSEVIARATVPDLKSAPPPFPAPEAFLEQFFVQRGIAAAAWLVGKREHRAKIHATGRIDFHIPLGEKLPKWFELAYACLTDRPGWKVRSRAIRRGKKGKRIYTILWERWRGN